MILAVDPGDVHVGWAEFSRGVCLRAVEKTPAEFVRDLKQLLLQGAVETLIIEEFRLYPWSAGTQTWSDFPTSQLIGVGKYLWAEEDGSARCELVMQKAEIKKPTRAILRAKGIRSRAKRAGSGGHASDAELHGYHYILNTQTKQQEKQP